MALWALPHHWWQTETLNAPVLFLQLSQPLQQVTSQQWMMPSAAFQSTLCKLYKQLFLVMSTSVLSGPQSSHDADAIHWLFECFLTPCCVFDSAVRCSGLKTQPDSMSQNARKALPRNLGTPTDTPPSTLLINSKGLNPSPKRAVRDPKTGRGILLRSHRNLWSVCNSSPPLLTHSLLMHLE